MTNTGLKVFVNGTFDVLHCGHIELINYAKSCGGYLLVALDTDERVRKLKGASRPVNCIKTRSTIMKNLRAVDEVVEFSSEAQLANIIREYVPDVMVVGSDYKNKPVVGSTYAKQLVFFNRIRGLSTSATLNSYTDKLSENNL